MYSVDKVLLIGATRTGGKHDSKTVGQYTIASVSEVGQMTGTSTRVIGTVMFDPKTKAHYVKTASGINTLKSWLS